MKKYYKVWLDGENSDISEITKIAYDPESSYHFTSLAKAKREVIDHLNYIKTGINIKIAEIRNLTPIL